MTHRVITEYAPAPFAGGDGLGGLGSSNIKVYVRARPLPEGSVESTDFLTIDAEDSRKLTIKDPDGTNKKKYGEVAFQFDRVFWTDIKQEQVFEIMCQQQVDHILEGYNSCCFACKLIPIFLPCALSLYFPYLKLITSSMLYTKQISKYPNKKW